MEEAQRSISAVGTDLGVVQETEGVVQGIDHENTEDIADDEKSHFVFISQGLQ